MTTSSRYACVHGHFYQPPRENPWLEAIEWQDSAYPYHDWNDRINAECYAQNGASRMRDADGRIRRIVNNYARISFNIGPTLLSWMRENAPDTYQAILDADRESIERFSGHGAAMAQAYNHMIMPLACARDQETQVRWGIRDFEARFGRKPEGMWLPETAVDLPTLDVLARHGIRFTVLSPYQAGRVRPLHAEETAPAGGQEQRGETRDHAAERALAAGRAPAVADWQDVSGGRVDPSMPYLARLPTGRSIALFFYDGPISQAVAFERLLDSGDAFARRLLDGFADERARPQLVHIATDGESYGHHHRHGDMALAAALARIEADPTVALTVYGEHLARTPPTHQVEILEDTAWSCAHGLGRWAADCGCNSGAPQGWHQRWRAPLRAALDWLRDQLAPLYEREAGALLADPWAARDEYIDVVLDRDRANVERFLTRHARGACSERDMVRVLGLLEMQRHTMLMYTSCGWFFNDISGIETVQILQYAGRALQLARDLAGTDVEAGFLEKLDLAPSNVAEHQSGRVIYEKWVRPLALDVARVGGHYAISSLFAEYPERSAVYCYDVERRFDESLQSGRMKMTVGSARVTSHITWESADFGYAAIHFGDTHVLGGVREGMAAETIRRVGRELSDAFARADVGEEMRLFHHHFGDETISLRSLFRDEQRRVVTELLDATLEDLDRVYMDVYQDNAALIRFLADLGMPIPGALQKAAEHTLNLQLAKAFGEATLDPCSIAALLAQARERRVTLDAETLEYTLRHRLEGMAREVAAASDRLERLGELERALEVVAQLPFEVDLWSVRNTYYRVMQGALQARRACAEGGDRQASQWLTHFAAIGERLRILVP